MKKLFLVLLVVLSFIFISCERLKKDWGMNFTYKDPQTIGGRWTVTSGNKTYEHLKCTYWGTEDDTSIFEDYDGHIYVFSGTMSAVKE